MMKCGRGCTYDQQLKVTADLMSSFDSNAPYSNSIKIGNDFQLYNDMLSVGDQRNACYRNPFLTQFSHNHNFS
jgi:hypothetical protein